MSIPKKPLQIPTCIPKKFTSMEDRLGWIASHKSSCRDIDIQFRILSIVFCVEPTSCSIQIDECGNKAGFLIQCYIHNKLDSYESHLFEKQIFFQYLKEYFLTPDEYEQWMDQYSKDIKKSKDLKIKHNSGICAGPDKCRYCIHEEREHDSGKCAGPDECRYCIDEQREHDSGKCSGPQEFCRYCAHKQRDECNDET
jgi:hypothetical protein